MRSEYQSTGFYIDGAFVEASGGELLSLEYPATGDIYARVPKPTDVDADRAIGAARGAFEKSEWSRLGVHERSVVIRRAASLVEERVDDIARMSAFEIGAPVGITRMMVRLVIRVVTAMTTLDTAIPDTETRSGLWEYELQREPRGVVLDLVPWNGPFGGTMMKAAQALLAGCTVVSKPPPTAPFAVLEWARALEASGLPSGAFNILPADAQVSEYMVGHPGVDLVVFTGGTSIGRRVAALCGQNLKPVVLELGGKSAAVVLDDADMQLAVDSVASGVYFNSGQICSALSRMLVPRGEVDLAVQLLRDKAEAIVIGDPLATTTTMGPMASRAHHDRVLHRLRAAEQEGTKLVFGGGRPEGFGRGWYVEPTLFVSDNNSSIAREEVFGPVVTVIPHDGDDDAVALANDSDYGLGGSVFSVDTDRAKRVASRLETGSVTINGYTTNMLAPRNPFKSSGIGTVTGAEGFQAFRRSRVVNIRASEGAWTPTALFAGDSSG